MILESDSRSIRAQVSLVPSWPHVDAIAAFRPRARYNLSGAAVKTAKQLFRTIALRPTRNGEHLREFDGMQRSTTDVR